LRIVSPPMNKHHVHCAKMTAHAIKLPQRGRGGVETPGYGDQNNMLPVTDKVVQEPFSLR